MAHSESQLETWSHQGSTVQSAATYSSIRRILSDASAPYAVRNFDIFLQGSYGNDTNIYSDSDVDIVICLSSVYYADTDNLDTSQKSLYDTYFSAATYSWQEFRSEVLSWLTKHFGNAVTDGKKAIKISGNGTRRDADVLVCAERRRYMSYRQANSADYHKGIVFWDKSGLMIENFPKQHQDNSTSKHQGTNFKFKPNVRILKNYRNSLIASGKLSNGIAPSYFIEGLLWNMPSTQFHWTYRATIDSFLNWLADANSSDLTCANGLHWLVRDGRATSWPIKDFNSYITAIRADW